MIRSLLAVIALSCLELAACSSRSDSSQSVKHYQLNGEVTALNQKDQTATIKAGAIKDWMEAMTMEYPVASKQELDSLHVGDYITATIDVKLEGNYSLTNIKPKQAGH